ncbi:MAG TPA: phosphosulfolactate synthase [Solirubrobacteraceae bacterium]|nr:phosphosulfolactate synthase [Solirubrobacteraceae bacterium]
MDEAKETAAEALGLSLISRGDKPRERGITMVMDQGWPIEFAAGMLDQYGAYLDIAKLWDPHLLQPAKAVRRKIEVYREYDVDVQPGGIFVEMAKAQGRGTEIIKRIADMGFTILEMSSTTSARGDMSEELEQLALARELGLKVIGEVGRKFADGDTTRLTADTLDIPATVHEFQSLLEGGAWKVYWEGHLLREVLGDDPESIHTKAPTGTRQVLEVVAQVGAENIIFEASGLRPRANRQWLQFWLVRLFGPHVNIGNGRIEELANMEALRSGTHPVFGFGSAGNYPAMRALESGETDWWRS